MKICGFQQTSLIDFPGRIASIVFLGGCNFRCPFCQNTSLVTGYKDLDSIDPEEVLNSLEERKGFVDGVEITGGEPLINGEKLIAFLKRLRQLGLAIKLDTNGYFPDKLVRVVRDGLVDYIAMDVKTSLDTYHIATGVENINPDRIAYSIRVIMNSSVDYEFRTTCVPGLVESRDVLNIAQLIQGAKRYYLQQFRVDEPTLDPSYIFLSPHSEEKLEAFRGIAQAYVRSVVIRGM